MSSLFSVISSFLVKVLKPLTNEQLADPRTATYWKIVHKCLTHAAIPLIVMICHPNTIIRADAFVVVNFFNLHPLHLFVRYLEPSFQVKYHMSINIFDRLWFYVSHYPLWYHGYLMTYYVGSLIHGWLFVVATVGGMYDMLFHPDPCLFTASGSRNFRSYIASLFCRLSHQPDAEDDNDADDNMSVESEAALPLLIEPIPVRAEQDQESPTADVNAGYVAVFALMIAYYSVVMFACIPMPYLTWLSGVSKIDLDEKVELSEGEAALVLAELSSTYHLHWYLVVVLQGVGLVTFSKAHYAEMYNNNSVSPATKNWYMFFSLCHPWWQTNALGQWLSNQMTEVLQAEMNEHAEASQNSNAIDAPQLPQANVSSLAQIMSQSAAGESLVTYH